MNASRKGFTSSFNNHEVFTVTQMKWNGIKNGKLLSLCVENNFDILLTIDKNMMYQQHIVDFNITVVVLNSSTSKIDELVLFIPSFELQANLFEKKKAYLIDK
jgi:hypothetical protein